MLPIFESEGRLVGRAFVKLTYAMIVARVSKETFDHD